MDPSTPGAPDVAPARSRVPALALALVAALLIARTLRVHLNVASVVREIRGRPLAAYFQPGLLDAVEWIRGRNPPAVFSAIPYEQDRERYERMGEMLYPIRFLPPAERYQPGDLVAVPHGFADAAPAPSKVVFRTDAMEIRSVLP